jgi:hypothetical protein
VRLAAIVKVDLAVSPDVVTILLLESVRKCWLAAILIT